MSIAVMEDGPRKFHVSFETRPVENRNKTIEQGMPVYDDVDFAIITMSGGKQVLEKEVNDTLLQEWKGFKGGSHRPEYEAPFAIAAYDYFKEGKEAPINGTDLRNWAGITPAQIKMCHGAAIRSVEELAECNEEGIRRIGMDGYVLKNKAAAYLDSAKDNQGSEKIAALMKEVESLMATIDRKDAQIAELEAELEEVTGPKPKRGRPKKEG